MACPPGNQGPHLSHSGLRRDRSCRRRPLKPFGGTSRRTWVRLYAGLQPTVEGPSASTAHCRSPQLRDRRSARTGTVRLNGPAAARIWRTHALVSPATLRKEQTVRSAQVAARVRVRHGRDRGSAACGDITRSPCSTPASSDAHRRRHRLEWTNPHVYRPTWRARPWPGGRLGSTSILMRGGWSSTRSRQATKYRRGQPAEERRRASSADHSLTAKCRQRGPHRPSRAPAARRPRIAGPCAPLRAWRLPRRAPRGLGLALDVRSAAQSTTPDLTGAGCRSPEDAREVPPGLPAAAPPVHKRRVREAIRGTARCGAEPPGTGAPASAAVAIPRHAAHDVGGLMLIEVLQTPGQITITRKRSAKCAATEPAAASARRDPLATTALVGLWEKYWWSLSARLPEHAHSDGCASRAHPAGGAGRCTTRSHRRSRGLEKPAVYLRVQEDERLQDGGVRLREQPRVSTSRGGFACGSAAVSRPS